MPNRLQLKGLVFGRLTVIDSAASTKKSNGENITKWVCLCECGKQVVVATQELRKGDTRSCGCLFKEMLVEKHLNENNSMWKGDRVGYGGIHEWVRRHKTKPSMCESCLISNPHDLANISQEYKRDVSDWEWLCRKCHMTKDGRLEKFILLKSKRKKSQILSLFNSCGINNEIMLKRFRNSQIVKNRIKKYDLHTL